MKKTEKKSLLRPGVILFAVLLILQLPSHVFAQEKIIKGHVSNEGGQPLQGATVAVKGTTKGASKKRQSLVYTRDAAGTFLCC